MHGPQFHDSCLLGIGAEMENIPDLLVAIFPI